MDQLQAAFFEERNENLFVLSLIAGYDRNTFSETNCDKLDVSITTHDFNQRLFEMFMDDPCAPVLSKLSDSLSRVQVIEGEN